MSHRSKDFLYLASRMMIQHRSFFRSLMLFYCSAMDFSEPVSKWKNSFSKLYAEAKNKNIPVYISHNAIEEVQPKLLQEHHLQIFRFLNVILLLSEQQQEQILLFIY